MRILAVEDEALFANVLEMLIDELGYELIAIAKSSEEFLRIFASTKPDLALIDINIAGSMDGIELAEQILQSSFAVPVIFITAFHDNATFQRAKKAKPHAFLTKPIDEAALQRSIELAFENFANTGLAMTGGHKDILVRDSFFVKTDQKLIKIRAKEILYVESEDKYCQICLPEKSWLLRMTLKDIVDKLPPTDFIRIHKGVVINVNFVEDIYIKENYVVMSNKKQLPIGKNYKQVFFERLNLLN